MAEGTLPASLESWANAGRATSRGQLWTVNISESRNAAAACSLSQILQANVPRKYFLSAKACAGILRRAEKRGKELPAALRQALESVCRNSPEPSEAEPKGGGMRTTDLDGHGAYIPEPLNRETAHRIDTASLPKIAWALQERDAKGVDSDTKEGHLIPMLPLKPAWQRCECCDDFWCNIHEMHTGDCDCPPIDEWETDPYGNQIEGPAQPAPGAGNAIAFKPSHFTRCKDGAPSETYPPLSADADKGDQEAVVAYRTAGNCGPFEQGDKTGALNTATDPNQHIVQIPVGIDGSDLGFSLRSNASHSGDKGDGGMNTTQVVAYNAYQRTVGPAHSPLTSEAKGRGEAGVIQGYAVRRLSPIECLRLQGFPDDWMDGLGFSDSTVYRCAGNAVTVSTVRWIAERIKSALTP